MRTRLRSLSALSAVALSALMFVACQQAKSPDEVAAEVEKAQDKSSSEVAGAEQRADKDVANAAAKVGDKLTDLNNDAASDAYQIAVAKADGDRKVDLAQCDALSGDARAACRKQADADYDAAKADAKATEQSQKK